MCTCAEHTTGPTDRNPHPKPPRPSYRHRAPITVCTKPVVTCVCVYPGPQKRKKKVLPIIRAGERGRLGTCVYTDSALG